MSLLERIENIERILVHKFGKLDLDKIKKEDSAFFKEANERLEKINKSLDENDSLIQKLGNKTEKSQ